MQDDTDLEEVVEQPKRHHDMMDFFDELSIREKFNKVVHGLKQPKDSGDYKYAVVQLSRLSAPLAAIVVPCLAICVIALFAKMAPTPTAKVEVRIIEPEQLEELEEIEEVEIEEMEMPPDEIFDNSQVMSDIASFDNIMSEATEFSPQPADMDSVSIVKSPVTMKGIYGSRNPGSRGGAMGRYGAPKATEECVLRALRWLKREQSSRNSLAGARRRRRTSLGTWRRRTT